MAALAAVSRQVALIAVHARKPALSRYISRRTVRLRRRVPNPWSSRSISASTRAAVIAAVNRDGECASEECEKTYKRLCRRIRNRDELSSGDEG